MPSRADRDGLVSNSFALAGTIGESPLPPGATPMYSLDSPHPDRLRCDLCGWAVPVTLDAWDDPEPLRLLSEDEAAAYSPELATDVGLDG
jgi:hypothetical protein